MASQPAAVIAAIETALSGSPDNHELRIHLAELLLKADRNAEALLQASLVLAAVPDHLDALRTAAQAAHASGQENRAKGFLRLLTALGEPERESSKPVTDQFVAKPQNVVPFRRFEGGLSNEKWRVERAEIKLADVAGLEAVKRRLELSLFAQLRHDDLRKYYGRSIGGGLLLYGPPGCGKTFVARATAGELGAHFMPVGLNDVLDMWVGRSERNLHEIFQVARRNAPCVLFIDEIDALGHKRSQQSNQNGRNLVNQLLSEMDGLQSNNDGLFVLAATNHPWDVDSALRRPGRFDRAIFVAPPDGAPRKAILAFHMRERTSDTLDLNLLVARTDGFSGADLAHLCDTAAEHAMEDSMATGNVRPMQQSDFLAALKEVRPTTRTWLETAKDYALFSNAGGEFDDLLEYLRSVRMA